MNPMFENTISFWLLFNLAILIFIWLDFKFFHAKEKTLSIKTALIATSFWIGLALAFNLGIYWTRGLEDALSFLTGYLIEYSLSIDNLFVFLIIFSYFKVPERYTHKALLWGIWGAIVMRAFFILCGIALIQTFSWVIYLFGAFLIFTGVKLGKASTAGNSPENNLIIKIFKRYFPLTEGYEGDNFFVKREKKLFATPLFLVLLAIETTDVVFAIDSIPAIMGITQDAMIIYSSNIFAVLGLRSLYFALANMLRLFHYLHYGLAIILVFIGLKMLLSGFLHFPIGVTLSVIFVILVASIGLSFLKNQHKSE
ncbi:putative membrane protein [Neochlamydia sp. EPS4]|nr:putative membrane protein [Neochlamydia sp. EPS4]